MNNDATEATMREVRDILAGVNTEADNSRPTRATEATLREVRDLLQNGGGGGGGGGDGEQYYLVNAVIGDNEVTIDKTADEILSAYTSGKFIVIKDSNLSVYMLYSDEYVEDPESYDYLTLSFARVASSAFNISVNTIEIYWDNDGEGTFDITLIQRPFYGVPSYSKTDAGKVLAVDRNGHLEWKTI